MLVVIFASVLGVASGARVVLEPDHGAPTTWVKAERVAEDRVVQLLFALKQSNLRELDRVFWAVSDPRSSQYGKHLSRDEVNRLVAPPKENVQLVISWLKENGVEKLEYDTNVPDFLSASMAAKVAERLLGVRRSDLVTDPALLRTLYNVGDAVGGKSPNNSQSIVQFLGQFFWSLDLQEFFTLFYQAGLGQAPKIVGPDDGLPGAEASLDTQYIMSMGAKVPTTFWSNKQTPDELNEPFLYFLRDVAKVAKPPLVFSISYGDDGEPSKAYAERVSTEFQKQGARGLSFIFASGDSGVGGSGFNCKAFVPDYPATSPYVTAVGGTALPLLENGPEYVNGLSGGGFSNVYARPAYQVEAVSSYLVNNKARLPNPAKWNSTGRGYPDVAAMSSNFVIVLGLVPMPGVAGTSCAAPTFAGIISLLNDLRLASGKPPLGFLNPFIYQHPYVFNDITQGSNPGCGTDGFKAALGWDPATGFGSPNYLKLKQAVLALP